MHSGHKKIPNQCQLLERVFGGIHAYLQFGVCVFVERSEHGLVCLFLEELAGASDQGGLIHLESLLCGLLEQVAEMVSQRLVLVHPGHQGVAHSAAGVVVHLVQLTSLDGVRQSAFGVEALVQVGNVQRVHLYKIRRNCVIKCYG